MAAHPKKRVNAVTKPTDEKFPKHVPEKLEMKKNLKKQAGKSLTRGNRASRKGIGERRIEAKLIDGGDQFRLLAESAQDFIFIVDRALVVRYCNGFGAKAFDREPAGLIGKPLSQLFPLDIFNFFRASIETTFETLKPVFKETLVDFPAAKGVWLETKLTPILDGGGFCQTILGISRDISDRKLAQAAIIERERFLSNIFSSILDGISIMDTDMTILQANPTMEEWYRHSMPIVGKKCYEAYQLKSRPCVVCPSMRTLTTGKAAHEAVPRKGKNGEINGWQECFSFPLFDPRTGRMSGVIEYIRDISERKKAEEELLQSEHKFRTLAETVAAGIAILKNGHFCYANQYLLDVTGYSLEELKRLYFLDIIHPDFREIIKKRQEARLRGEEVSARLEFKVVLKNGKESWVHQSGGIVNFEGEPATLITVWDATEEKNIRGALAAEKERLDVTLASIGEGVISTDIQANILTFNKAAETLTGFSRPEAINRSLDEVCCIVDETTRKPFEGFFQKMIDNSGILHFKKHCLMRSKEGFEYQVELSIAPIISNDEDIIGMVLVFSDVTEKLKLESEIFKIRKLESLGMLAGGIAHDFNNILTGIITNLFMAKCNLPQAGETYNLLVDAEKACFRASRLTKQLLTFSKGGAPLKEVASMREIIEETVGFSLSGSNATYSLELPDDLLAVNIDKGQIDQVINNLLLNAQQSMPSGGMITVKAENATLTKEMAESTLLGNSSMKPGRYIKVSVRDEGCGISRKDLERVFDPYFTTKTKGTGLGLTTSYAIIKNHDGIITVDSEIGRGSLFSFYLPALDVSLENSLEAAPKKNRKGGKILVMDDDDAVRTVVSQILRGYGYKVSCLASSGETIDAFKEALQQGEPFDVVIMDLTIPGGMGGKETVKLLQEIDPGVRAIVTSGYSNDPIMSDFREYGFSGVIAKPFVIDDFIDVIEKVIEKG